MYVEFDPDKDAINVAKHGVSLAEAAGLIVHGVIKDDRFAGSSDTGYTASWMEGRIASPPSCATDRSARSACAARMPRSTAAMSSEPPVIFDDDNPEWTEEDFARARRLSDFPELMAALVRKPGRPVGSTTSTRQQVTLRIDREVLARLRASGPGWQTRVNETLRGMVGL